MVQLFNNLSAQKREWIFQIALHILVFFFYASSRNHPEIRIYEICFFLNSVALALALNYYVIPKYLYTKKYSQFVIWVIILIIGAILMEELVLEQIFFPDTRGTKFPGLIFTLLGILPVSIIIVGFKMGWDALLKQYELEDLRTAINESELKFLKSQINPHFLFNNLNNLYAHAIEQSPKTPDIILELSGVLRYMLYDCKAKYVDLHKEIEQLKNFINVSQLQIEERGTVEFNAELKPNYRIAPLIMMVFVENAFKHSTASQANAIEIKIDVQVSDAGELKFYCGNSYDQESNTQQLASGIGLENVKKRLNILYPNAHQCSIQSTAHRFEVFLTLDLNTVYE